MTVRVRDATVADMVSVCELYNALITTTTVAWTPERESVDERVAWFRQREALGHPVLVAEDETAGVVGFCAYGEFRDNLRWPGYRHTVEHTIHVADHRQGQGVGRALLCGLVEQARHQGVHVMVAALDGTNEPSRRFHERLGFKEVARLPEVGRKFDRWLDLVLMQRILD